MTATRSRWAALSAALVATLAFAGVASAQEKADQILATGENRAAAAAKSQKNIDKLAEQTQDLNQDYKSVLKVIDGLKVYNRLLSRQLEGQRREMKELEKSIDEVSIIERQVVPLMMRMLDSLEQFVELDVPFLPEERRTRIDKKQALLEDPNVTSAEKFREVLEVFQIENEFGRTIEAYDGALELGDGTEREVQFLRIGRISLTYQSIDGSLNGVWDQANRQWVELSPEEYKNHIARGLKVAKKQLAPDLLIVPVNAGGAR